MNESEAIELFERHGAKVVNGQILAGSYRHGRIGYADILLEDEKSLPLNSLVNVTSEKDGKDSITFIAHLNDETVLKLPRSWYEEPKRQSELPYGKKGEPLMPNDVSSLEDAWGIVFPDFKGYCWHEETTGGVMVDTCMIGGSGVKALSDTLVVKITGHVQRTLRDKGCVGRAPSQDLVRSVLTSMADDNRRNAFIEAMRGDIWDRKPRLDRLFIDVFGGRMPGLDDSESEEALSEVCRCWFIGGVARQYGPVQLDILPVMIGLTNIRKTSAVKWMAMEEGYYQSALDLTEKTFVEGSKGKLVIEISEMNGTKGQSNAFLKGFLSKSSDNLRMAYDRFATENVRRFIMIGTTNEWEMLTDPMGNRRYFPFEVDPERATVGFGGFETDEGRRYIRQVWSEAFQRYHAGEGYRLSARAYELCKRAQEAAVINNPDVDLLSQLVDEARPLPGEAVCINDLVELMMENYGTWECDARKAAHIWWKIPHPDWGPSKQMRLASDGRKWAKDRSASQKCRVRIHPPGYEPPSSLKMLGE